MRIDARSGCYYDWHVYDVKRCHMVKHVVWCDDVTAQWGQHTGRFVMFVPAMEILTYTEDRISFHPERKLVLFNEVEDLPEVERVAETETIARN